MKTGLARIFVKNPFCTDCVPAIKKKVMEAAYVKNVNLDPSSSLVVFNFNSANQVSEVLNTLIALGYPMKDDHFPKKKDTWLTCKCAVES